MNLIDSIERRQLRKAPGFAPGDRVKVHFQVIEGNRSRTQVFEGIVIRRQGAGVRETFTVRKQSFGVGVERTFPLHSPKIEKIEIAARGEVRRAKLYYLRGRIGRRARVRERSYMGAEESVLMDAAGPQAEALEVAAPAEGTDEGTEEEDKPEAIGPDEERHADTGDDEREPDAESASEAPPAAEADSDRDEASEAE